MPSSTDSWGIEIGSHAIKAIRLTKTKEGIRLADHKVIPHARVLTTPDLDVEEIIRTGLAQFASKHQIGRSTVVVSVPGNMAFARFAKLPPVEPKRVPDIVKFEAVQQIPFPIDQVEWDYQIFQEEDSPDVEVGIFAIMRDRVLQWLEHFKAAQIPVHTVTLSPLAMYNAMNFDGSLSEDETDGRVLIDVGTLSTDLVVVSGNKIWMRTLPIGGHHFTEAVSKGFKLNYTKAEKLKKEAAKSKYARQVFQTMRPVFVDLVTEVQKSLGYYQSMQRDVQIKQLIGMGSTFRLPGLQKFIKQQLQLNVSRLSEFKRIEPPAHSEAEFAEHAPELATAYGLALQGVEEETVSANILPASIIRDQIWGTKNRWIIAATACLAIAAVIPNLKLTLDSSAYANAKEEYTPRINSDLQAAQELVRKLQEVEQDDPRAQIDNVRTILDYREIWALVLKDIDLAQQHAMAQHAHLKIGDEEQILKIPREQRKLILIDSIQMEYLPSGTRRAAPQPRSGRGRGGGGQEAKAPTESRPVIQITLKATTPYIEGIEFIRTQFQDFFEKQAEKQTLQRPYTFRNVTMTNFASATSLRERGGGTRPRPPAKPEPDDNPLAEPLPGTQTDPTANINRQIPLKTVLDYFPAEPLTDEPRTYDGKFDFSYQLVFRDAQEAREIMEMTEEKFKEYLAQQFAQEDQNQSQQEPDS